MRALMTHPASLPVATSTPTYLSKHRVEALADGLFAIVMTLLVLELKVPELPHGSTARDLWLAMQPMWRVAFSFVLTFFLSSMFWMLQQSILTATRQIDKFGVALHLAAMMFVSLLPFSTAMLGHYISSPLAMGTYFGNQSMIALLITAAWLRERRNRNVGEMPEEDQQKITIRTVAMSGVLVGACIAACIDPHFAFLGALPAIIARRAMETRMKKAR